MRTRLPFAIALALATVAGAFPITSAYAQTEAPAVIGPEYPVVQKAPDNRTKGDAYCHDYFVLEAPSQWAPTYTYLAFHYRDEHGVVQEDEALLKNVTLVSVPDAQANATPAGAAAGATSLPKVTLVGMDGGEKVWILTVTKTMESADDACLHDVPRK